MTSSNPVSSDLAARMVAMYQAPHSEKSAHLEESSRLAAHHYRELRPKVDAMPKNQKGWESMLKLSSYFKEADVLLKQLSDIEAEQGKKSRSAKVADKKEPLVKRLQSVREKILDTQQDDSLHLIQEQEDHNIQTLVEIHQGISSQMDEKLEAARSARGEKTGKGKKVKKSESRFERLWSHPLFSKPLFMAVGSLGIAKQLDIFMHTVQPDGDEGGSIKTPLGRQSFLMSLGAAALSLAYIVPHTIHSMCSVVKKIKEAASLKGELREGHKQLENLRERSFKIQDELINQRLIKSADKYWISRLEEERDSLIMEEVALKAKLEKMEEDLRKSPLATSVTALVTAAGIAEIGSKGLEIVKTLVGAGFKISANVAAKAAIALQFLGPIASGLQLMLGGGMLAVQSKKLHALKSKNRELKAKIAEAESKMNPTRRQIKLDIEKLRANLRVKKLDESLRVGLELTLQQKIDYLNKTPPKDLIEHFYDLESDRLKLELMANNRNIGLMRLAVANSTLLTVGGAIGFAASVGSFAFPVSITLGAIALTLLTASLVISTIKWVKEKRSAEALKVQQKPLQMERSELVNQTELLTMSFRHRFVSEGKQKELNKIWDALIEKDPKLANLPRAAMQDPKIMQAAFETYFKDLRLPPEKTAKSETADDPAGEKLEPGITGNAITDPTPN